MSSDTAFEYTAAGASTIVGSIAELVKILGNLPSSFEVSGNLADKIFKIKSEGLISWGALILLAGIAYGIYKLIKERIKNKESNPNLNPEDVQYSEKFAAAGITKLNFPIVMTAVSLCEAAGGIGILHKLGQYEIAESSKGYIKMVKKTK